MGKLRRYRVTWYITNGSRNRYKMSAEVDGRHRGDAIEYIRWLWLAGQLSYRPQNISAKWIDRPE